MRLRTALLFGLLLLGLGHATSAWALHLSVIPSVVDAEVAAGSTLRVPVRVVNGEGAPVAVRAYFQDWWHDGESPVFPPPATTDRSAVPWSSALPVDLVVAGGETGVVEVFLSPPEDASGSYTALLFVEAGGGVAEDGASIQVGGRIGVPIAVRIQGTGTESVALEAIDVSAPTSSAPLRVEAGVRNEGDVHVAAVLQGVVLDPDGEVRARLSGEPVQVLPGQRRTVEALWGDTLAPGTYDLVLTVGYGTGKAVTATRVLAVDPPE